MLPVSPIHDLSESLVSGPNVLSLIPKLKVLVCTFLK